jgi:hypothetical protein
MESSKRQQERLDHGLEETFPASDPIRSGQCGRAHGFSLEPTLA